MSQVVFPVPLNAVTQSADERGFTLIELMVVVVILGILAAIAIPKFTDVTERAKAAACRSNLAALARSLNFYAAHNGAYPSAGLPQNWRGFSGLEGYLAGANSYRCPLTGSSDYRYRLYGNDESFGVRGWLLVCRNSHGHITHGVASWQ
jgi:prepilin-type N-terminal cleavage/methylation domain-containing protein